MADSGGGGEPELPNMRLNRPPCPEMLLLLFPASFAVGIEFRFGGVDSDWQAIGKQVCSMGV